MICSAERNDSEGMSFFGVFAADEVFSITIFSLIVSDSFSAIVAEGAMLVSMEKSNKK